MRVKDIMAKDIKTCRLDDAVDKIARDMVEYNVSMLVVVSKKDGKVIPLGVVTKSDIAFKVVSAGRNSWDTKVREIFSAPVRTVYEYDSIDLLSNNLHARNLRNMVVLNEDDEVIGVCGTNDILRAAGGSKDKISKK